MLISKLGEFGLIERISRQMKTDSTVVKASGDDCAVLKFDKARYLLFTCDMLVEGVDFLPSEKPGLVGRKALAVSISDIAACAGIPRYAVVALGVPRKTSVEKIDKLMQGMLDLARRYKINIVGGDLSRASRLTIDVSMLGVVEKKYLALRSSARIKDIIFVSGGLGGALYGRHLRFEPRLKEARFLARKFKVGAMIDISDGLAQDLGHILKASKVGAVIYSELIPLHRQARNLKEAFSMGEDFELIFTLPYREAKRLYNKNSCFHPIGEIVDKKYGLRLIDKQGREKIIPSRGFKHF